MDSNNMSKANIIIAYDGEALKDHSIDIQELAIALSGLGEVFQEANQILNKDKTSTSIKVKAFQCGSFEIHFDVIQKGLHYLSMFNSDEINGALNLAQILGYAGAGVSALGLFQFIKKINGEKIKKAEEENDNINIETEIGQKITVNKNVYILYNNIRIRKGLEKALSPLSKEGIDKFEIKQKIKEKEVLIDSLLKEELSAFAFAEQETTINEYETVMFVNLISPCFEEGNKWKFSTKDGKFFALIKDEIFLNEVNNGSRLFGKGDILKILMLVKQSETGDFQIKNEYEIKEVLDHKRHDQLKLF